MDQGGEQNLQEQLDEAAGTNGFLPRSRTNQGIEAAAGTQPCLQEQLGQPADPIGLSREFCTNQRDVRWLMARRRMAGIQILYWQLFRHPLSRSTEDPHSQRNIGEISEQEALRSKRTKITFLNETKRLMTMVMRGPIKVLIAVPETHIRKIVMRMKPIIQVLGTHGRKIFFGLVLLYLQVLLASLWQRQLNTGKFWFWLFIFPVLLGLALQPLCPLLPRNIGESRQEEQRALRKRKIVKEEKKALVDENDRLKHEILEKIKLIHEKDQMIISNMKVFKAESQRLKHEIEVNEQKMKFNLAAIEAEEWTLKREIEEKKQLMKSSLEAFEKGRLKSELKENEQLMKSSLEEFEFGIQSLMYEIVEKEQLMKSNLEAFEAENGRLKREIEEKEQLMESNMETFEATIRQLNNEVESLKGNNVLVNQRLEIQSAKLAELRNKYDELKH